MSTVAKVEIHSSQFPENVRRDLLESLRSRQVNHKFHYDSVKQTQKWLALHQAYSPSRNDPDCARIYNAAFAATVAQHASSKTHVISLGCGGGQKDLRLLKELAALGKEIIYTPSDVSTAMVLVARQMGLSVAAEENCLPFVCDLASADDLPTFFQTQRPAEVPRLITFFGMIPNFEPDSILPKLAKMVRPRDQLLVSANLAPGPDYADGVHRILPQYDNELTHDWLMTFLLDLGVNREDGELKFTVQEFPPGGGLRRVAALFHFSKSCRLEVEGERIEFAEGESIRLFFSYRYTPDRVRRLLGKHGFELREQWITDSEEEGVFLCRRA
jgi:L-histidine N-alpha-methyltransferase